ncbi:MAG: hypothetical protein R3F11_04100 [Verrucomicrobiales bacterium]
MTAIIEQPANARAAGAHAADTAEPITFRGPGGAWLPITARLPENRMPLESPSPTAALNLVAEARRLCIGRDELIAAINAAWARHA